MRFSKIILSSLIATFFVSCEENSTIGSSIISDEIEIVMDSTYTVTGKSIENDKVQSRSLTQLLGVIDAKGYGSLKSDIVTQFMPAGKIDTVGVTENDIDSLKLRLSIPIGGVTGDSIVPMGLNVYKLNKQLPSPIYSDFDPKDYFSTTDLIGSTIYSATALGQPDSIAKLSYRYIDVKLPVQLGREFFNKYKQDPELFLLPSEFAKWFPGIYISNTFGSGRITTIGSTEVKLYYHKTVKKEGTDRDTTIYKEGNYFAVTPEIISNNNISLSMSNDLKSKVNNGEIIVVAPTGMDVEIKFPAREIIESYKANKGNLSIINALSFEIPAEAITNNYNIMPPPYLLLIQSSKKDKFFADGDITNDKNSFYATYNAAKKVYLFSNMRQYIIDLLSKSEITEDDITFTLTPVSLSTENSSSSYYYESTTYINDITPYVYAPVMAKLNIDKAKVKFTYSKQTIKN